MRFRIEQTFAGAVDAVGAAFLDPAFLEQLGRLPKLGSPTLVREAVSGDLVHRWVRYHFVGEVNAAVRRVIDPKRLSWVEESTLHRATHHTTWRIVPDHYAGMIRCAGTFQLEAIAPEATRRVTEAEIKVSVPLVGARVERAIVSGLEEHAAGEEAVMNDWLEHQRP